MKLKKATIKNFRRLENINIDFEDKETIFVGPNNSGKTSATYAFRTFLNSQEFKIHDFSTTKLAEINALSSDVEISEYPFIQLDLWFIFDPESIAFGRAFSLLSNISDEHNEVGVRCVFKLKDHSDLLTVYGSTFPLQKDGTHKQSLVHYLSLDGNLKKHFELKYFSLERGDEEPIATILDSKEGRRILSSLIRVDFIDAQRHFTDAEGGRTNKLSSAFAYFYEKNLDQANINEESVQIINDNNQSLTEHYGTHFFDLLDVIKNLGVPSANDRDLKIVSSLSAQTALKGNTELMYIDADTEHELPEAYNGLGFKNLVYMAVQIKHYHLQWINTEENRPLCQVLFIEEPEVHLHVQVMQTFITSMWSILNDSVGSDNMTPQLTVTTHSPHILDAVEFAKVRYFRRCHRQCDDATTVKTLNATEVHNLRDFKPEEITVNGKVFSEVDTLKFLKRYLTLTHCDLFFADAAILVEGAVERLLMPAMLKKTSEKLRSKYITILEVGGAYAHRFRGLLSFLHIPYVVLTDIDSVELNKETSRYKACSADTEGAITSNPSIKSYFPSLPSIKELSAVKPDEQILEDGRCYLTYQKPVPVTRGESESLIHGRTFEETFIYENIAKIDDGTLVVPIELPDALEDIQKEVYENVRSSGFTKTEFALDILSSEEWDTPIYIKEGLDWLESKLDAGEVIEKVIADNE